MSEAVYLDVERAIREKLYIGWPRRTPLGGPSWAYPDHIELGEIVMRDADCGLARPTFVWTPECWQECKENLGMWKKVGMWSFVRAEDPAADAIAYCHRHPEAAGRELSRLRALDEDPND